MQVRRIVANLDASGSHHPPVAAAAHRFYAEALGLDLVMDHGWLATYAADRQMPIQVSIATEGGAGTAVPDISVEVDDLDAALERLTACGFHAEYGPVEELWGVRRFFVRDPFGKLVNILQHL